MTLKAIASINSYLYQEMEPSQPIVDQLTRKTCRKNTLKNVVVVGKSLPWGYNDHGDVFKCSFCLPLAYLNICNLAKLRFA